MPSETVIPPVLMLEDGLVGLPDLHELEVLPIGGGTFVVELAARDMPGLGWLAAAAEDVRPGMTSTLRACGRIEVDEVLLVLLASHGEPPVVTANLAGPLAIDVEGRARQIVLEEPGYELRAQVGSLAPARAERG